MKKVSDINNNNLVSKVGKSLRKTELFKILCLLLVLHIKDTKLVNVKFVPFLHCTFCLSIILHINSCSIHVWMYRMHIYIVSYVCIVYTQNYNIDRTGFMKSWYYNVRTGLFRIWQLWNWWIYFINISKQPELHFQKKATPSSLNYCASWVVFWLPQPGQGELGKHQWESTQHHLNSFIFMARQLIFQESNFYLTRWLRLNLKTTLSLYFVCTRPKTKSSFPTEALLHLLFLFNRKCVRPRTHCSLFFFFSPGTQNSWSSNPRFCPQLQSSRQFP